MATRFVIDGAEALEAQLKTLPANVQKRVVRKAVRASQNVLVKAARDDAGALPTSPLTGGRMRALLRKHIVPKVGKQRRGSYSIHVQMRSGVGEFYHTSQKTGNTSYIPAAIEYGHGSTKELAARPFLRPAARRTERERMRVLSKELASGILREAIKGRIG